MRKIVNSTYISLDGVVEEPHLWPTMERPPDARKDTIQTDLLQACDAVLDGPAHLRGIRARLAVALRRSVVGPHEHDPQVRRLDDPPRPGLGQHDGHLERRRRARSGG